MMLIPLTKGYEAIVDEDDYERVMKYKWHSINFPDRSNIYASRAYREGRNVRREFLHRFIMNAPQNITVDHIDRNGLNCQKNNLRFATRSQQNANRNGSSKLGFRGIHQSKRKWIASLWHERQYYYGGTHFTMEDAAKAYDALAKQIHGEFATLNFPEVK